MWWLIVIGVLLIVALVSAQRRSYDEPGQRHR